MAIPLSDRACRGSKFHKLGVLWYRYCFLVVPLGPRYPSIMGLDKLGLGQNANSRISVSHFHVLPLCFEHR